MNKFYVSSFICLNLIWKLIYLLFKNKEACKPNILGVPTGYAKWEYVEMLKCTHIVILE